ncbi:hypothetical protein IC229_32145 [Spirosoma sp. BT702]|uniref:Uncharacterized protein n=1 Tax=Spirosoma profusum TaxID=2771354 RepID=A0A927AVS5_9BACT|nr:hypothetical protein [Spirosoma profusum]MBD2705314.1 hypothetical protein [Spirosoma profusum]
MLFALYGLSTLSLLFCIGGLWVAQFASKFEGGAGIGGSLLFLIGAICSGALTIVLYRQWAVLSTLDRVVGGVGCLPLLTLLLVLVYVLFIYK